ncbi:MliC family protein [Microbulbifer hainanensis]|uniref:MliC family protein n=1 Tax=Microbulbifer hainanensis TaxID=2735675 RepID=UPI0018693215|nr:MliC family protein [Microbulbifer hainanensis]
MYRLTLTCIVCAALVAGCNHDGRETSVDIRTVDYQCENSETLQVKYVMPQSGPSMATLAFQNKLVPMHQERAASGVLYVADKGQPGYRWHSKGDGGILQLQELGEIETATVLKGCSAVE